MCERVQVHRAVTETGLNNWKKQERTNLDVELKLSSVFIVSVRVRKKEKLDLFYNKLFSVS